MGRNSVVTKTGSTYKITQGTAEFSDYRRWYLNTSGKALAIADSLQIARVGADGIVEDTSPALDTDNTSYVTMAINRDETKAYIIMRSGISVLIFFRILTISDMTLTSAVYSSPAIYGIPLRAIISSDEKIVWLGDNNTLYKMDLDGGNLIQSSDPTLEAAKTFFLSPSGLIYRQSTNAIYEYDNNLNLTVYPISLFTDNRYNAIDGFVIGDEVFVLTGRIPELGLFTPFIYVFSTVTKTIVRSVDLATYGLVSDTLAQFNASGADNYATFSCTIEGRQTVMQCNLDTLECLPARRVDYAEREIEYSNDAGKPIEKLGIDITKANNCDWKGLLTSSKGATGSI